MIGLGKWALKLNTYLVSDTIYLCISDNNGVYDISVSAESIKLPEYKIESVREDGNTLIVSVTAGNLLQGRSVDLYATFEDDTVSGYAMVPSIGKFTFKNGKKVE